MLTGQALFPVYSCFKLISSLKSPMAHNTHNCMCFKCGRSYERDFLLSPFLHLLKVCITQNGLSAFQPPNFSVFGQLLYALKFLFSALTLPPHRLPTWIPPFASLTALLFPELLCTSTTSGPSSPPHCHTDLFILPRFLTSAARGNSMTTLCHVRVNPAMACCHRLADLQRIEKPSHPLTVTGHDLYVFVFPVLFWSWRLLFTDCFCFPAFFISRLSPFFFCLFFL